MVFQMIHPENFEGFGNTGLHIPGGKSHSFKGKPHFIPDRIFKKLPFRVLE